MSTPRVVVAPIEAVTVTEDRASVQRCASIDLPAGITRVRIEDVSPVIVDKTLRVCARSSSSGVAVGEARVVRRTVATEPARAHAALVSELAEKRRECEVGASNVKRLQAAIVLLQEAQKCVAKELAEDAARGTLMDVAEAKRATTAFEQRESDAYAEAHAAIRAQRDLERTIERLKARLVYAGHQETRVVASIEITLDAKSATKTDLVVEYIVPGACWRPAHTATLRGGTLSVTTDGCVWQNTGEDWPNVALKLSTERPSLGQKPPTLFDDELVVQRRSDVVRVEQRNEAIQHTGLGGAPQARVPGIDDGGDVRVLAAKSRATIPSDGRPYRVPALAMETKSSSSLVAYPELAEAALVRAVQTNAGSAPLLAGPVDLVRESGFVGRTKLPLIAAGEKFELGFGPDPHVRVRREIETVDEEPGLLSSTWIGRSHRVRVHLSNLDTTARSIEITERVPVSEIEKVEIDFDEKKTTPKAKPDADGFVKWTVDLPARGRASLELRYVVRRHRDVVGL
ncbi:MAG: mucoidy inhibitor MuiA family protein [Polyangiaceae bacterium]|nr:mucoidy inhibitor MuiA family protein [Polyangiaceae bacterium]